MKLSAFGFGIFLAIFFSSFLISASAVAEKQSGVTEASDKVNPSSQKTSMTASAKIPSVFLGKWAIESEHCGGDIDYDDVITIEDNNIAGYEIGCILSKGTSADNKFSGKFLCNESGEEDLQFKSFKLDEKGVLTIASENSEGKKVEVSKQVYVSCHS